MAINKTMHKTLDSFGDYAYKPYLHPLDEGKGICIEWELGPWDVSLELPDSGNAYFYALNLATETVQEWRLPIEDEKLPKRVVGDVIKLACQSVSLWESADIRGGIKDMYINGKHVLLFFVTLVTRGTHFLDVLWSYQIPFDDPENYEGALCLLNNMVNDYRSSLERLQERYKR